MTTDNKISYSELHRVLHYDELTGIFRWKIDIAYNVKKGTIAGTKNLNDYICIWLNNKKYAAHILAWFYVHGYWSEYILDHKDRVRSNNAMSNLREVSQSCNLRNTGNAKDNTSGVKGVSWSKKMKKWKSSILRKHLGYYKDFDDAVCARLAGEQCLDWANCNLDSPAYLYVQNMGGIS